MSFKLSEEEIRFFWGANPIRQITLRKLLLLYYCSYLERNPDRQIKFRGKRKPRIYPGLDAVKDFLDCEKSAAMDYLQAMYVIDKILFPLKMERMLKSSSEKWLSPDDEKINIS